MTTDQLAMDISRHEREEAYREWQENWLEEVTRDLMDCLRDMTPTVHWFGQFEKEMRKLRSDVREMVDPS